MPDLPETRHLSVHIRRPVDEAYAFLAAPDHFPQWASGLGTLRHTPEGWFADTPDGPMRLRFSEPNPFGVLDHWVFASPEAPIYVPMRVVAHGAGCELTLTLFRQPGMSDERFQADAEWVMRDLQAAKALLETRQP